MADVSICMPYYERMGCLKRTITSFKEMGYFTGYGYDVEISICDDGSVAEPIPQNWDAETPLKIAWLPKKTKWKNPCVPRNISVRQTDSPLIVITCAEVYHETPIIKQMADMIEGENDVVLPLVWAMSKTGAKWHSHPIHRPVKYCFSQMMTRHLFEMVGGFTEIYRDGSYFDDADFKNKLDGAGAKWKWANECRVIHPVTTERGMMPNIKINRRIYQSKWLTTT